MKSTDTAAGQVIVSPSESQCNGPVSDTMKCGLDPTVRAVMRQGQTTHQDHSHTPNTRYPWPALLHAHLQSLAADTCTEPSPTRIWPPCLQLR